MSLRHAALGARLAALVGIGALVAACDDAGSGDGSSLQAASFPLFADFDEEDYNRSCSAFRRQVLKSEGEKFTETSDVIQFTDIYEGIAHAKKVDKPIFVMTYVLENGDPACDV
jgi:hypothetical protein